MLVPSIDPDKIWFSVADDPPVRVSNWVCKLAVNISSRLWMLARRVFISLREVAFDQYLGFWILSVNVTWSSLRVVMTLLMEWERVVMEVPTMLASNLSTNMATRATYSSPEIRRLPLVSVPVSVARTAASWFATEVVALVLRETILSWSSRRLAAVSLAVAGVAVKLPPKM